MCCSEQLIACFSMIHSSPTNEERQGIAGDPDSNPVNNIIAAQYVVMLYWLNT